jgi:5'-methylthioadenosine/S-adenosylhomocysteine nucleosidase
VPAAAGTRLLLDRYQLEALIVFGVAGGLSPALNLGDLVIATELIPGDTGVAHSGGFSTTGPGQCEDGRLVFHPSFSVPGSMVAGARAAAESAGLHYHLGRILTCDQIVLEPELRVHLGDTFDALAVEMEGAAAAQVAASDGVPFMVVRAISDELSHDLVGFEDLLDYRGQSRRNIWHKRFRLAVTSPETMGKVRDLAKGRDLALESMASFLSSLLSRF